MLIKPQLIFNILINLMVKNDASSNVKCYHE